jgi:hypothetical protein
MPERGREAAMSDKTAFQQALDEARSQMTVAAGAGKRWEAAMSEIPEGLVERLRELLLARGCPCGNEDLAEALDALGGERVWIVNTAHGHRYAIEGSWRVAKHLASGFGMSHAPCSALLIPLGEEGEQ